MAAAQDHPLIQDLIDRRERASELSAELANLAFRQERGWASEEELARLKEGDEEYAEAVARLRVHLRRIRRHHQDLLDEYYKWELDRARAKLMSNPEDGFAALWVERWQKVIAGDSDDVVFTDVLQ